MKYVDLKLVKNYLKKNPVVSNGEFGYNENYDFCYYQRSMVMPSGDCFAYKFYDFDVISYRLPYLGDLYETNEIDVQNYIKYVMDHIDPKLLESYKKDLNQYWLTKEQHLTPSQQRAKKIKNLFEKDDTHNIESCEKDILSK